MSGQKNFVKNEYYERLIANAPENIRAFWAMNNIRSYLDKQNNVGYDVKSQKFSHFVATDKSRNEIEIKANKEKYLLIDFTSSNCGYCLIGIDKIASLQQNYQEQLEIVSVWDDPSYDVWVNAAKKQKDKISWTNLWDESGGIFKAFNIKVFPTYLLVDSSGKVVKRWQGRLSEEKLVKYF